VGGGYDDGRIGGRVGGRHDHGACSACIARCGGRVVMRRGVGYRARWAGRVANTELSAVLILAGPIDDQLKPIVRNVILESKGGRPHISSGVVESL
jgi:hypothetical protein